MTDFFLNHPQDINDNDDFAGFQGVSGSSLPEELSAQEAWDELEGAIDDCLPRAGQRFSVMDDYGALMRARLPAGGVYQYGAVASRRLAFNTPLPAAGSVPHAIMRARHRYVVCGRQPESRFLFSLTENGVNETFIREHLEQQGLEVPYLVASYHGLLGMALVSAACEASRLRNVYEPASPEVSFPPVGESPFSLGELQDLPLPTSTRWLASLCAPVRFNSAAPVTYEHFIPNIDEMVRWQAIKDRYRCREYHSALPLGVAATSLGGNAVASLTVKPIDENHFMAARRHPVVVTMPSGAVIIMCLNTMDGFGEDRHDRDKSPLLEWALTRLHATGGINTVYRHGLQRTVFALLAEECYNAAIEQRRPNVPWVGQGTKSPRLPVVLDHEVVMPAVHADDAFRHFMHFRL